MDFKKATDALFARVTHDDLAEALGVSVALIRQARLSRGAKAYRTPPDSWEGAVSQLAERQSGRLGKLAKQLKSTGLERA
jgi:hypothetical protein